MVCTKQTLLAVAAMLAAFTAGADEFEPPLSARESMEHHRKVPSDLHWWAVTGEEMGWMHKNVQQLFPTVPVFRGGQVRELEYAPMDAIADFTVQTPNGKMRFEDLLADDQATTLGVVILHQGKIVFESYPRMKEHERVIYWSTSKVFAGTIVRLLEERGLVDISDPIENYVPALANSAFAGTTVRNLLDHATGLDCDDNYTDIDSCYYQYSMALGDNLRTEDAPDNPYDYLASAKVDRLHEQGTRRTYSGANNFILAWLVQEVTGLPFQDVVTREFWARIGAESDAGFIAYRYGIPTTHGGFYSRLRDLARFGLLFTPSSTVVTDRQIISDEFIEFAWSGGNPNLQTVDSSADETGNQGTVLDSKDRATQPIYQWNSIYSHGWLEHGGWGGQGLLISPTRDVVAVYAAYFKGDYSEIGLGDVLFDMLNTVFPEPATAN